MPVAHDQPNHLVDYALTPAGLASAAAQLCVVAAIGVASWLQRRMCRCNLTGIDGRYNGCYVRTPEAAAKIRREADIAIRLCN